MMSMRDNIDIRGLFSGAVAQNASRAKKPKTAESFRRERPAVPGVELFRGSEKLAVLSLPPKFNSDQERVPFHSLARSVRAMASNISFYFSTCHLTARL